GSIKEEVMATKQPLNEKQAKMWDDIKEKPVEYYALPNITVDSISEPLNIDPEVLYLKLKGPLALVSIENVLNTMTSTSITGKKVPLYTIELRDELGVIQRNPLAQK